MVRRYEPVGPDAPEPGGGGAIPEGVSPAPPCVGPVAVFETPHPAGPVANTTEAIHPTALLLRMFSSVAEEPAR